MSTTASSGSHADANEALRLTLSIKAAGINPASVKVGRVTLSFFPPAPTSNVVPPKDAPTIDLMREHGGAYADKLEELERKAMGTPQPEPEEDDED